MQLILYNKNTIFHFPYIFFVFSLKFPPLGSGSGSRRENKCGSGSTILDLIGVVLFNDKPRNYRTGQDQGTCWKVPAPICYRYFLYLTTNYVILVNILLNIFHVQGDPCLGSAVQQRGADPAHDGKAAPAPHHCLLHQEHDVQRAHPEHPGRCAAELPRGGRLRRARHEGN